MQDGKAVDAAANAWVRFSVIKQARDGTTDAWAAGPAGKGNLGETTQRSTAPDARGPGVAENNQHPNTSELSPPLRAGDGVIAPSIVYKTERPYTDEARRENIEGTVLLYVQVGPNGKATNIRVLHGLGHGLDENAIDAVRQWLFKPGLQDGKPVMVEAQIEVNFQLLKQPNPEGGTLRRDHEGAMAPGTRSQKRPTILLPGGTPPPIAYSDADSPTAPGVPPAVSTAPASRTSAVQARDSGSMKWAMSCTECEQRWDRGRLQKGMRIGGVTTWISVVEQADRFAVTVSVLNDSGRAITVKPEDSSLALSNPPAGSVSAVPMEKLLAKHSVASRNQQLADSLLLATTVDPGREADGIVYYPKKAKKYGELVLTLRVGTFSFEFPWFAADR
jgi:TonB family protein